MIFRHWIKVGQ